MSAVRDVLFIRRVMMAAVKRLAKFKRQGSPARALLGKIGANTVRSGPTVALPRPSVCICRQRAPPGKCQAQSSRQHARP
jgi:hypothetical protein